MATSSDDAQYLPSRYSRTKTGTFAPTFTLRTRSLRTTLPAKSRLALSSSASRAGTVPVAHVSDSQLHGDVFGRPVELRVGRRVQHDHAEGRHAVVAELERDGGGLARAGASRSPVARSSSASIAIPTAPTCRPAAARNGRTTRRRREQGQVLLAELQRRGEDPVGDARGKARSRTGPSTCPRPPSATFVRTMTTGMTIS